MSDFQAAHMVATCAMSPTMHVLTRPTHPSQLQAIQVVQAADTQSSLVATEEYKRDAEAAQQRIAELQVRHPCYVMAAASNSTGRLLHAWTGGSMITSPV